MTKIVICDGIQQPDVIQVPINEVGFKIHDLDEKRCVAANRTAKLRGRYSNRFGYLTRFGH